MKIYKEADVFIVEDDYNYLEFSPKEIIELHKQLDQLLWEQDTKEHNENKSKIKESNFYSGPQVDYPGRLSYNTSGLDYP